MLTPELSDKIYAAIQNGQTQKAISLLVEEGNKKDIAIAMLSNRWNALNNNSIAGIIEFQAYAIELNQINLAILKYINEADKNVIQPLIQNKIENLYRFLFAFCNR